MKKILFFLLVLSFVHTSIAQNDCARQSIRKICDSIEANASDDANEEALYKLKRLDVIYPNEWLIKYYISYCMFRRGLLNQQNAANYFNQAIAYLDELDVSIKNNNADILCLEARILIMCLGYDQTKGAEFTPKIAYLVQEAMKIAPNNSRVVFVNGLYKYYMPSFCGGNKEEGRKEFVRSYTLFMQEPKDVLPVWNEKLFKNMILLTQK